MDTETYELLRSTVRRFVEERLVPQEDQVEADDAVPDEIVAEMRGRFRRPRRPPAVPSVCSRVSRSSLTSRP